MGDQQACTQEQGLTELGAWLAEHAVWWKPRPFVTARLPWADAAPDAHRWLLSLSHDEIDKIESAGSLPDSAPEPLRSFEATARSWVAVPEAVPGRLTSAEAGWVPGRKRRQIEGIVTLTDVWPRGGKGRVVDWCGGKGHLGRSIGARTGCRVLVVEREVQYRDEAEALGRRLAVDVTFCSADVLRDEVPVLAADHAVALHACGALGVRLLELATGSGLARVILAPCCLHKDHWRPLSQTGRRNDPGFDHSALRLATSDEVVAPPRLRVARRRENAWRLGLDALLREASGVDVYTPLGTLPGELLKLPFEGFCHAVAAHAGLRLPGSWDAAAVEADAWRRAREARALGLVRGLFRRALEVWVVRDRAAYLAEAGYAVEVRTFAPREVTPRNLVIDARRE